MESLVSISANILAYYGMVMGLLPTIFPWHLILLLVIFLGPERIKLFMARSLSMRFIYGCLNPLAYLLLHQDGEQFQMPVSPVLNDCALAFLLIYWLRYPFAGLNYPKIFALLFSKVVSRILTAVGLALIAAYLIKDTPEMLGFLPNHVTRAWTLWGCAPLYLIPAILLWKDYEFYHEVGTNLKFLRSSAFRFSAWTFMTVFLFGFISWHIPYDRAILESEVRNFRQPIYGAAKEFEIEPMLLKAIIIQGNIQHATPLKTKFKRYFSQYWAFDEKNHHSLTVPMNFSQGPCQVKPSTAMEYMWFYETNKGLPARPIGDIKIDNDAYQSKLYSKQMRGILTIDNYYVQGIQLKFNLPINDLRLVAKKDALSLLQTPEGNIRFAAFILRMIQEHWKAKGFDISNRPDIIATIYNIGFKNSHPKANPQPNEFGKAVLQEMQRLKVTEN